MALSPEQSPTVHDSRDALPSFDLAFRYDDAADPAELTVFPAGETDERTTAWLTMDLEYAVSLETVR